MNDSLSSTTTYSNSNGHSMSFLNNKRKSDSSSLYEDKNDNTVKKEKNKLLNISEPIEEDNDFVIEIYDEEDFKTETESDIEDYEGMVYYQKMFPNLISNLENKTKSVPTLMKSCTKPSQNSKDVRYKPSSVYTAKKFNEDCESVSTKSNTQININESQKEKKNKREVNTKKEEENEKLFEQKLKMLREQYIINHKIENPTSSQIQVTPEKKHRIKIPNQSQIQNSMNEQVITQNSIVNPTKSTIYISKPQTQNIEINDIVEEKTIDELNLNEATSSIEKNVVNEEEEENYYNSKSNAFTINFDLSNSYDFPMYADNKDDGDSTKIEFQSIFFE